MRLADGRLETFRLYFVDTTESRSHGKRSDEQAAYFGTNTSAGNRTWQPGEDIHGKRSCTGRSRSTHGLARIYGTRTPLPNGRDSREYLAHLHALENEAKAAKRGGWGMVQP